MPYIKLLTVLTTLALLTACGGGGGTAETKTDDTQQTVAPCVANPFATGCTAPTPEQAEAFCGDTTKTTDTKTNDCAPTVNRVCTPNPFDTLCPDDAVKEEAFCRDTAKTTDTKANDCAPTVMRVCTANVFDLILCTANEYVQQRNNFNSMCINQAGKTKEICDAEALVRTCAANPFMNTCLMDTGAIALRETMCLANIAIDDSCRGDMGIATLFCEANPFDTATACMHGDYADDRQTACLANIMIDDSCRGTTGIATLFCEANPFDTATACMHGDYADERQTMCLANIAIDGSCRGTQGIATVFCTANPFDPSNACMHGDYADERLTECTGDITTPRCIPLVTPVCEANNGFNNPVCRGIEKYDDLLAEATCAGIPACTDGVITHADWLASFTANGGTALPTTPNATRKNEFLQGTTTGFASGANAGIRAPFGSPRTDIPVAPAILTFDDTNTATGGVAFFGGEHYNNGVRVPDIYFHYAGVLAGTDLGAPITAPFADARWDGKIRADSSETAGILSAGEITDFVVDITFDGTEGEITSYFTAGNVFYYSIDGKFDANGIITGDVAYGQGTASGLTTTSQLYSPGTLTGIIGQNGAVGAFISGHKTLRPGSVGPSFSGGFIAAPPNPCIALGNCPVNTAAWLGSFTANGGTALPTTPDTTRRNQFLQGTPADAPSNAGLNAGVGYVVNLGQPQPTAFIVDSENGYPSKIAGIGGDAADGFAFFRGQVGAVRYYYASILPTTNLGAPLTESAQGGTWEGILIRNSSAETFILTVDFGESEVSSPASGNDGFSLKGEWDERGVITGTTLNAEYLDDARTMLDVGNAANTPGILTGLIGQEGAVGVFHSDGTAGGYSGGFIAAPTQ